MVDASLIWVVVLALLAFVWWRTTGPGDRSASGRRVGGVGSAAAGAFYDLLNEDKRKAIEVIVEERAGERDPEDRDGNLPDLERPS
jgi:hypothetical protein